MKNILIFNIFLLLCLGPASAEGASPYKTSWETDGILTGLGITNAIVGFTLDNNIINFTPAQIGGLNKNDINWLDIGATENYSSSMSLISDYSLITVGIAPAALMLDGNMRNDAGDIGLMYGETMMLASTFSLLSKVIVQRARPFVYNPEAPDSKKLEKDARRSFFSGHSCTAFASAVFVSTIYSNYYPDSKYKPYVWGGSLLSAALIGYMRYESGKHFPTDIITGAAVGSLIGYLVPYLHENYSSGEKMPVEIMSGGFSIGISVGI